jgi:hypothetical protein
MCKSTDDARSKAAVSAESMLLPDGHDQSAALQPPCEYESPQAGLPGQAARVSEAVGRNCSSGQHKLHANVRLGTSS